MKMVLFKKKQPEETKANKMEVLDANISEKEIDYKAEYERLLKLNRPEIIPEPPPIPKFEDIKEEEDKNAHERVIKNYTNYVTLEPDQADQIKINLLFSILDELKKLNEKAE